MKRNTLFWRCVAALPGCLLASHCAADVLPTSSPEAEGLDSAKLLKMLDYLQTSGFNVDSVVLARHGNLVLEAYAAPYRNGIPHQINSATKSFVSTLAGMAVADGKLSLDDPIAKVLPEYANLPTAQTVTLRQLLEMNSGVDWNEWPGGSDFGQMLGSNEPVKTFLQHPVNAEEVGHFNYNSGGSHVAGAMVARAEGQSLGQFAQSRLFGPLGFTNVMWQQDSTGTQIGGRGLYLLPEDLLKLGEFYRLHGKWNNEQLLPESWVDYVTSPLEPIAAGTGSDQYYGAQWWVKKDRSTYAAAGWGGQYLFVFPQEDMTLALTSRRNDYSGTAGALLDSGPLLTYFLHSDQAKLPPNPEAAKALRERIDEMGRNPAGARSESPLQKQISGKAIEMNNPHSQTEQWRLEFDGNTVAVTQSPRRFDMPTLHYTAGLDGAWRTTVLPAQGAHLAARARWLDANTFALTITELEEYYTQTILMKFNGNKVKIDVPGWDAAASGTLRK
ncbi:serine hydrolase domain-containing protein [Silvimonas amylolytica]|uniref:Beta-lactamase-related domain-containing protein n=1 Tax=Silvimonas amylolytica TaxID=449663 RepID=A0ABQ2PIB6_9NEIS|nr:serine hydrolase [Silvimonas amylolytica]GGP25075.1 hypothetical protein GCM10010971_08940 [Silvimonas amylolytica]